MADKKVIEPLLDESDDEQPCDIPSDSDDDFTPAFDVTNEQTVDESSGNEEEKVIQAVQENQSDGEVSEDTYLSKDKTVTWSTICPSNSVGRIRADHIINGQVGVSRNANSRIGIIMDTFELCFTRSMRKIVIDNTNLEGQRVYSSSWKPIDDITFQAYLGLLILSVVHKSHGESLANL